MNTPTPKEIATNFLELVGEGSIDEAYERYIDSKGVHHNVFTPAGFKALREGMKEAETRFPNKQLKINHVIAEGNYVAIHSHLTFNPGEVGMVVVHIFRIEDGKIVELWDCGQAIPENTVNTDGAF